MTQSESGVRGPNRRRVLAALGGAVGVGIAGCLSGESAASTPTERGDEQESPTPDATATDDRTEIPASKLNPADEFDCETLGSSTPLRTYDAVDRPFVFTFGHPEGWIPEAADTPTADAIVVHAPYELETGGFLFDVYVRQYFEPVAEDVWDQLWDDSWEEVGTLDFGGEQRRIVEKPAGDPGRYILSTVVPDGGGAYRQITLDAHTLSFDEACHAGYRDLGDAMVQSLRPRE